MDRVDRGWVGVHVGGVVHAIHARQDQVQGPVALARGCVWHYELEKLVFNPNSPWSHTVSPCGVYNYTFVFRICVSSHIVWWYVSHRDVI